MRIAQRSNPCVRDFRQQRAQRPRPPAAAGSIRTACGPGWSTGSQQLRLGTASSARARQAITAKVARELIRATARKLRKRADALDETSTAEAFHEVRIRAKRLRYALDAFGSLYGDAARELPGRARQIAARARRIPRLRGAHEKCLPNSSRTGRRVPAATSFLVGRLVERDRADFRKVPAQIRQGLSAHQRGAAGVRCRRPCGSSSVARSATPAAARRA